MTTRISFAMARNILRKLSACMSSRLIISFFPVLVSFVTPSTMPAISCPNMDASFS